VRPCREFWGRSFVRPWQGAEAETVLWRDATGTFYTIISYFISNFKSGIVSVRGHLEKTNKDMYRQQQFGQRRVIRS
jgi:hypothetical protein